MTPITTARPTIVRTIEPPPGPPADDAALPVSAGRLSGVFSPSAANAAGAVSRQPRTAAPRGRRKAGKLINTEGDRAWIGLTLPIGPALAVLEPRATSGPDPNPALGAGHASAPSDRTRSKRSSLTTAPESTISAST